MFVMIDLGNDVCDDLVVYLGGPKNRMDDCFVSEDDVVGERRLESTLGRTDGLRASSECIHVFFGCCSAFRARKAGVGCCWVWHGGGAMGSVVSTGIERLCEGETNEEASLYETLAQ